MIMFGDLRIDKFRMMTLNCFNLENSYERAAKVHAVNGTVLSSLTILGGVFLISSAACGLAGPGQLCGQTSGEVAIGGTFLLTGVIFLIFSILLLHRLRQLYLDRNSAVH